MTTPDTEQDVQELTDENLEEVSGAGKPGNWHQGVDLTNLETGLDIPLAGTLIG
jgi:hypothetical protein